MNKWLGIFVVLIAGGLVAWRVWANPAILDRIVDNSAPTRVQQPVSDPAGKNQAATTQPSPVTQQDIKKYTTVPEPFLDPAQTHQVKLETNLGEIVIELFVDEVPVAANNFAFLVKEGFYDGLTFHRVVEGFMIQGGDPSGDGTGGPGYKFEDETINRKYDRGIVAYANSGPNTNGSQFFIMHQDYPLPPQYVIFGKVIEGMDTVDKIATVEVVPNRFGEPSSPSQKILIQKATLNPR